MKTFGLLLLVGAAAGLAPALALCALTRVFLIPRARLRSAFSRLETG